MKISFDSNAWEEVFGSDASHPEIRGALMAGRIQGFICDAAFRIEAVRKRDRADYFAQPYMGVSCGLEVVDGQMVIKMSMGPDQSKHPGLPEQQMIKLRRAFGAGIKLMHGQNWLGLPTFKDIHEPANFVQEEREAASKREERQIWASIAVNERGVGEAAFNACGGWTRKPQTPVEERQLIRACAEWSDGELVGAHIAYQNDILCTNDLAKSAVNSIFDSDNRQWLADTSNVKFMTVDELSASLLPPS